MSQLSKHIVPTLTGVGVVFAAAIALAQTPPLVAVVAVGSIGVEEGDPRRVFGDITGIATDEHQGVLFILDRLNHRLSAFRRDGRFIASAGRAGAGPGEFRAAIAVAGDGAAATVLDAVNLRLSTYHLRSDSFGLVRDRQFKLMATDICVLSGRTFVLGYHQGGLVQEMNALGHVTKSFGNPFREGDRTMAQLTAHGQIFCDPVSQSVLVAATSTPIVRRYSLSGALLWESSVPGMIASVISRTGSGVRFSKPPKSEIPDVIVSLTVAPRGRVLVQYGGVQRGSGTGTHADITSVATAIFDISNGAVLKTLSTLPRIDYSTLQYAYSHANNPFPRVVIYEWR